MNELAVGSPIDLSRIPLPAVIEALSYHRLFADFKERFTQNWEAARAIDPSLPPYDAGILETDPVTVVGQAWAYLRLLDRSRVNEAISALLAPRSIGADLDNVVARQGVQRLVVIPATEDRAAVLESDAALLRRYLLSFERPSAGSANRYLFEAWAAWPGMHDARVNGHAVHGRRGDTDIVIIGPDAALPTEEEKALVRAAVQHPGVQPEAVAVTVVPAKRAEFSVDLVIEVPTGPDPELVRQEVVARVTKAANSRKLIGGEVPASFLAGAAYGESVIRVLDLAPVAISPEPYTVPVMADLSVVVEVRL